MSSQQPKGLQEMQVFVQNLLQQMLDRYKEMNGATNKHIDKMANKVDDLEKTIGELMSLVGIPDEE